MKKYCKCIYDDYRQYSDPAWITSCKRYYSPIPRYRSFGEPHDLNKEKLCEFCGKEIKRYKTEITLKVKIVPFKGE